MTDEELQAFNAVGDCDNDWPILYAEVLRARSEEKRLRGWWDLLQVAMQEVSMGGGFVADFAEDYARQALSGVKLPRK